MAGIKEPRNISTVVLKLGLVLAVSLGGTIFTFLRSRRHKKPQPCQPGQSDDATLNKKKLNHQSQHHEDYSDGPCFVPATSGTKIKKIRSQIPLTHEIIQVLHEDNTRLKSKLADSAKHVMQSDVEIAKLRKKLEQLNRDHQTLNLQIKQMDEVKKANESLKMENSDLILKLEKLQILATSALEEDGDQVEELERLRQQLEKLEMERCDDMEELVYLRWMNACLRYQLTNSQSNPSSPGTPTGSASPKPKTKTNAKVLSKLSKIWRGKHGKPAASEDEETTASSDVHGPEDDNLDSRGLIIFRRISSIRPANESAISTDIVPQKEQVEAQLMKYAKALKLTR